MSEPLSPGAPERSQPPAVPPPPPPLPELEPAPFVTRGVTPMEAARLATATSALPGRLWGLPKLAARYDALLLALILIAGLVAYANSFGTDLVLDARTQIPNDPRLRSYDLVAEIFDKNYGYPGVTYDGLYRPLTTLSFLFNYTVLGNGVNPVGYHAVNWTLHAANACLVFYLVSVIFRSVRAGFAAAALFICHPANTEAVVHILGRADLLATFLILLGLFAHFGQAVYAHRKGIAWLLRLTVWGVFFLALLAKETGAVLLPLVMLFDVLFDRRRYTGRPRRDFWENLLRKFRLNYFWMLGVFLTYLGIRTVVLLRLEPRMVLFADNPLAEANLISRALTACKLMVKAAYTLVFPRTLSVDYSFNQIAAVDPTFRQLEDWLGVIALALVVGTFYFAWWARRRHRALTFWIGMFFFALLPVSSLLAVSPSIFCERWLYLPAISACALFGVLIHMGTRAITSPWWAYKGEIPPFVDVSETALAQERLDLIYERKLAARRRLGWMLYAFVTGVAAAAFGWRTFTRNQDWANELALWQSAAVACPDSAKTHKQLGWANYQAAPDGARIDESIAGTEKAILILPDYEEAYAHLGHYYGVKADVMAARDRAAGREFSGETQKLYVNAAQALEKAAALNRRASDYRLQRLRGRAWAGNLKLQLGNPLIYIDLGTVYAQMRQFDRARNAFIEAARLAPAEPVAHEGLGEAFANLGTLEDSAIQLIQALLLDAGRARAWSALNIVYQKLDPTLKAIAPGPQGRMSLNTQLPLVEGHVHRAFRSLIQALLEANQRDLAKRLAEVAVDQYGMPLADFSDLVRREVQRGKVLVK